MVLSLSCRGDRCFERLLCLVSREDSGYTGDHPTKEKS